MPSDLTPYRRGSDRPLPNVLNVGWIDGVDLSKGSVQREVIDKLRKLALKPSLTIRGHLVCRICQGAGVPMVQCLYSRHEIWLSSPAGGYFVAPEAILHFIEKHEYCPPDIFMEAVLQADLRHNPIVRSEVVSRILSKRNECG